MRLRLLTDAGLEKIKEDRKANKFFYQQSSIDPAGYESFDYPDFFLEAEAYPTLEDQKEGEDLREVDYRNSLKIYSFFGNKGVPLSLMHDERYMAYLTHFVYFDYMKKRWPISEGDESSRAASQYTFSRAPYARNGILRLFWPAYLISQAESTKDKEDFEKKLECYFKNRILLDRALERKYSVNPKILAVLIDILMSVPNPSELTGKKRSGILPKIVQNILTVTSLDVLSEEEAAEIVLQAAKEVADGKYDSVRRADDDQEIENTSEESD